jgi:hypothetical protein
MTGGGDPNDPTSKHSYGIYLYEVRGEQRKMTQLAPNVSAQNRTGGTFTSGLTYGISKVKVKSNLPGRNASLQIKDVQPVFTSTSMSAAAGSTRRAEFRRLRMNLR